MRNAIARGPFNDLIKELAELQEFRALIQVNDDDPDSSVKVQKMEDAELVLRFFALKDSGYKNLKKGFKAFLTDALVKFNDLDDQELKRFSQDFKVYMQFIHDTAGPKAFSKWRTDGERRKRMSSFNAAVYDAVAVGLSAIFPASDISRNSETVASALNGYESLFTDKDSFAAVSGSVNDAAKVISRIDAMIAYLQR